MHWLLALSENHSIILLLLSHVLLTDRCLYTWYRAAVTYREVIRKQGGFCSKGSCLETFLVVTVYGSVGMLLKSSRDSLGMLLGTLR